MQLLALLDLEASQQELLLHLVGVMVEAYLEVSQQPQPPLLHYLAASPHQPQALLHLAISQQQLRAPLHSATSRQQPQAPPHYLAASRHQQQALPHYLAASQQLARQRLCLDSKVLGLPLPLDHQHLVSHHLAKQQPGKTKAHGVAVAYT